MGKVVRVVGLDFSIQFFDDLLATEFSDVTVCAGGGCSCEEVGFFGRLWRGRTISYLSHEREEDAETA